MVKKRNIFLTLFSLLLVVILSIPMFCVSVSADEQVNFNGSHLLSSTDEIVSVKEAENSVNMPKLDNYTKVKIYDNPITYEHAGRVFLIENINILEFGPYCDPMSFDEIYSDGWVRHYEDIVPLTLISYCSENECNHKDGCSGFSMIIYIPENFAALYFNKYATDDYKDFSLSFTCESETGLNIFELVPNESSDNNQSSNNQTPVGKVNSGSFVQKISITLSAIMLVLLIAFIYHIITYNKKKNRKK